MRKTTKEKLIFREFSITPIQFPKNDDIKSMRYALKVVTETQEVLLLFSTNKIVEFLTKANEFVNRMFRKENVISFLLRLIAKIGFIILVFLSGYFLGK